MYPLWPLHSQGGQRMAIRERGWDLLALPAWALGPLGAIGMQGSMFLWSATGLQCPHRSGESARARWHGSFCSNPFIHTHSFRVMADLAHLKVSAHWNTGGLLGCTNKCSSLRGGPPSHLLFLLMLLQDVDIHFSEKKTKLLQALCISTFW